MITFKEFVSVCEANSKTSLTEGVANYQNSRGIERKNMPQIKSEFLQEFVKFLTDKGIKSDETKVQVYKLKPTQKDFNTDKVGSMQSVDMKILKGLVLKSSDGYILDGHHRYSALLGLDPFAEMKVLNIELNIDELLKVAFEFPKTFKQGIKE